MSESGTNLSINLQDKASATLEKISKTLSKFAKDLEHTAIASQKQKQESEKLTKAHTGLFSTFKNTQQSYDSLSESLKTNVFEKPIINAGKFARSLQDVGGFVGSVTNKFINHEKRLNSVGAALEKAQTQYVNAQDTMSKNEETIKSLSKKHEQLASQTGKTAKETRSLAAQKGHLTRKINNLKSANESLLDQAKKYHRDVRALTKEQRKYKDSAKAAANTTKSDLLTSFKQATGKIINLRNATAAIVSTYKNLGKAAVKVTKIFTKPLSMAMNAASRGLSLLGQNLIGVNEGFGRLAGGGLKMFQQALSDLVRGTLSRARQALTSFITDAFKQFSRLDKVAREVAIFSGTVDRSFSNFGELAETYRRQITNIAKQTIFSAEEIGRAMTSIASIGQFETPEQLKDVTEVAAALATATGSSFGPAGELLARTMNAFAEELKGAKNAAGELLTEKEKVVAVANILARVANDSALSMAELGDAMQYVSPLAVAAGISLQSSVSMVAALSNMGFNASRAGTAVAQMLEALTAPSAGAAKAMAKLDFSAFDDTGSLKDMGVIIMELKDRLGQLQTEEEQLAITQEVFGTRAGRAMLTLLNNTEQYSQLLRSLAQDSEEGFNLIQVANEEMMKSVAGQVSALEGQLADLRQAFIDALEPLFVNEEKSGILQTINTMLRDPQFVGMIDNIAQAVANLINFLNQNADILFGGLLQAVGSLIPILTFAISAFALLFKETEDGRSIFNMLIGVFTKIFNAIARVLPIVAALIDSFLRAFVPVLDIILDNLDEFMPLLVTLAKAFASMFYIAAPVMTALAELFVEFAPLINDLVLVFVNLLLPVFSALASVALYVIEVIKENQDEINDLIIGLGRLFHAIVQMLPTLVTLGQIFVDVAIAILPLINMILSLIVVVAEHLAVGLHKGQGNLVAFAKLVELIVNVISDAFEFMSQSILENLGIADEATRAFSNLVEQETNFFQVKVIGLLELAAQAAEAAGNTEAAAKYREDIQDIMDANAAAQEELDKVLFDVDDKFDGFDNINMDDFAIDIEFEYDTGEIDRLIAEVENSQLNFEDSIPDEDLIFEPGNVQLTLPDELENQIEENEALFGSISNILAVSEVAGALLGNAALNMNGQGDASGTGDSITDNSVNNSNNTSVDNVNVYISSDGTLDSDADTSTAEKAMDVIKAVAGGL